MWEWKMRRESPPKKKNALEEPVSVTEIETIPKSKAFHIQSSAKFGPWKPQKERNRFTGTAYAARASPFTNSFKMCRRKQLNLHDRKIFQKASDRQNSCPDPGFRS